MGEGVGVAGMEIGKYDQSMQYLCVCEPTRI